MAIEIFEKMRNKVLREHLHSIVRSAKSGHKTKGRGMVLVRFSKLGIIHLSYLTIAALQGQCAHSGSGTLFDRNLLIEKISTYLPESEIPVMFTDGEFERFSLGVRQPA
jgi:hypothetical protein